MLEDLLHWLIEEEYDFTVRNPAANVATVYIPTKEVNIHNLSAYCAEHKLTLTVNHADQEFIVLARRQT